MTGANMLTKLHYRAEARDYLWNAVKKPEGMEHEEKLVNGQGCVCEPVTIITVINSLQRVCSWFSHRNTQENRAPPQTHLHITASSFHLFNISLRKTGTLFVSAFFMKVLRDTESVQFLSVTLKPLTAFIFFTCSRHGS